MFHDRQNQFESANQQYLASSLLKRRKGESFSKIVIPSHNSINYDNVLKLADQIGVDRIVELK